VLTTGEGRRTKRIDGGTITLPIKAECKKPLRSKAKLMLRGVSWARTGGGHHRKAVVGSLHERLHSRDLGRVLAVLRGVNLPLVQARGHPREGGRAAAGVHVRRR
jgi:hypothetical protein